MSGYGYRLDDDATKEVKDKNIGMLVLDMQLMHEIKQAMKDHRSIMETFYLVWMASLGWLIGGALA